MCKSVGTSARICHVHHAAGNATQFVRLWITLRWLTVAVQLVVWEDVGFAAIIGVGCVQGKVVVRSRCLLSDF